MTCREEETTGQLLGRVLETSAKVAVGAAGVLGIIYLMLSPRIATRLYGGVMFHPHAFPDDPEFFDIEGVSREEIFFVSNNLRLHGWYFHVPKSTKTILFSHGNTGNIVNREHFIGLQLRAGYSVFIYDYRGYGLSEGNATVFGIVSDGLAAYDYLVKQRGLSTEDIVLYGESLGAAVSCQILSRRKCGGIVLQSGFSSLRKIGAEMIPFTKIYPRFLLPQPELDSAAILEREHPPLLIIHGKKDTVVPFSHGDEMYQRALEPKEMLILPRCGHNDICFIASDEYVTALRRFAKSLPHAATTSGA
jgi:fermentation-respiration switch protein FrsA (DUF1100 family)